MSKPDPYFLGYSQAEQERLERQAQVFARDSQWLFDHVGIDDGSRVIEIGCGPRGCLGLLSERVGPTGSVIGLERNAEEVQRAQQFVVDNRLTNVQVMHADARASGLPNAAFDLATARLLLVNVPNPEEIVAEMVRLVRPGGVVALHEADLIGHQMCHPPLPAWTRLFQLLNTYAEMNGIDRFVGRRVPRMLRKAGLVDVRVNPLLHVYPPDHGSRMILLEFVENVRDRLLSVNLISEDELNELMAVLKRHLEDPETEVFSAILIQAWGRTPEE
jgi:ubiquinone/menaquinone biosynthesis C-methylase UbiE